MAAIGSRARKSKTAGWFGKNLIVILTVSVQQSYQGRMSASKKQMYYAFRISLMLKILTTVLLAFWLSACSSKTPETSGDARDTVWGEQVKALDKARAVEQTVKEAAERARAAETQ